MRKPANERRVRRTVGSTRWAAWADALGFISELTTETGLRRRLHGQKLTEPVEWTRRIGGKFGVDMKLPAGCYSDDTQLRLATARAVHAKGFDVEAFTQVELSVWPSYALGGGRASKAAAANIAKPSTPWFGNFYAGWLEAGGNGVAMRIQPHVWAAVQPADLGPHLLDVIVNGATSHGHPRALVGAVLHALSLGATLRDGQVPPTEEWPELLHLTEQAVKLIDNHPQLASLWRPAWENQTHTSFADAWRGTVDECRHLLPAATQAAARLSGEGNRLAADACGAYDELALAFDLCDPATRGNATSTVLAALALAAAAPADPAGASLLAAQKIGTDTDTIATMAAALIGASDNAPEPPPVLDAPYLTAEAARLAAIANGHPTNVFSYPDLLDWSPPRNQIDAVGLAESRPALAGLGWLTPADYSEPVEARGATWRWTYSDFGASFLVKQRPTLRELPKGNWPVRRERIVEAQAGHAQQEKQQKQLPFNDTEDMSAAILPNVDAPRRNETADTSSVGDLRDESVTSRDQVDIDQMLVWVARRGYSEVSIGYATRRIAELGTIEQLIGFTTAVRDKIRNLS
jgi:ADP-ribosylglycohydrolase